MCARFSMRSVTTRISRRGSSDHPSVSVGPRRQRLHQPRRDPQVPSIVRALAVPVAVVEQVAREVIRHPFDSASTQSPLARYVDDGTLRITTLTDASAETWLSLVGAPPPDDLDDGEAATIAVAHHRLFGAVIDERKGVRVCSSRFPSVKHLSTLDLFRHPAVVRTLGRDELRDAVWSALALRADARPGRA